MIKKILSFSPGVIVPMLFNFVLTILYARLLVPSEYGILNIYLNSIQIVYALTLSIFQTASLRFYSLKYSYNDDERQFFTSYLVANIVTTLIIVPFAIIVSLFWGYNWEIVVIATGCNGLYQLLGNCYRLENKAKTYNIYRCLQAIISVIAVLLFSFVVHPLTYKWPIIAVYGAYGILAVGALAKAFRRIDLRCFNLNLIKQSLKYGVPLIGVSVLGYVIANSDQYFLLYFLGKESVGNYALGYRLVDAIVVNMLLMIILVMTPELNHIHDSEGAQKSREVLRKTINIAIWFIMPVSFAIIVYADYLIKFVFPEYTDAAHIMRLVVFASIFHGISMFTCKGLELVKKPKYVFYGLLIASIVNCGYNAIFIPIYGIDASAHSSVLAYVIYNILLVVYTKKYYSILIDFKYIVKTCLITFLTAIFAILLIKIVPIQNLGLLIIEGIGCAIFYLFLSWVMHLIKELT